MTLPGTFLDQTDEDWDRIVNVNLKGTFVISQDIARRWSPNARLYRQHQLGVRPRRTPGPPAYAAAKAGVEGLSRLMAVQLGGTAYG